MALDANTESGSLGRWSRAFGSYVNHENPLVRFVSLWLVCATLFVAAWYVGYYLLAGVALLAVANYREAAMIAEAVR